MVHQSCLAIRACDLPIKPALELMADRPQGMEAALDRFMDVFVLFVCCTREVSVYVNKVQQIVADVLYNTGEDEWHLLYTGSLAEGVPREACGDTDVMAIHKSWPTVIPDTQSDPVQKPIMAYLTDPIQTPYLTAVTDGDNPAFLTLHTIANHVYPTQITGALVKDGFVSNVQFVENYANYDDVVEIHGPAVVSNCDTKQPEQGTRDDVPCLPCPAWPPPASGFFTRHTSRDWPSQELLAEIKQAGCHVVPVGHPTGKQSEIEWRWSFSCAEKLLIHNMSEDMIGVMFALKVIKNKHWMKDDSPTTFCSYFIKTACLWVLEETDQSNIMNVCREVIDWLLTCYRTHRLPHYFIPQQNLISHLEKDHLRDAAEWLANIKNDLHVLLQLSVKGGARLGDIVHHQMNYLYQEVSQRTGEIESPGEDVLIRALMQSLAVHPQAEQILAESEALIDASSTSYQQEQRYWFGYYSVLSADSYIWAVMQLQIESGTDSSSVVEFPERVILKVLSEGTPRISSMFVSMLTTGVKRLLGDMFHSLSIHFKQDGEVDLSPECHNKAEQFYTEGLEMVYPDGWNDRGLGGYIRLAIFYYLNGEVNKLGATLQHLEPLLEWGSQDDISNHLGTIDIFINQQYHVLPWKQDTELYTNLIESWDDQWLWIHPVCMAYYIQARYLVNIDSSKTTLETQNQKTNGTNTATRCTLCCFSNRGKKYKLSPLQQTLLTIAEKISNVTENMESEKMQHSSAGLLNALESVINEV